MRLLQAVGTGLHRHAAGGYQGLCWRRRGATGHHHGRKRDPPPAAAAARFAALGAAWAKAHLPEGALDLPDHMLAPVYTIAGQLLGVFASLERGLKPDAPSAGGVIHRVVQGVTIYPREHTE